MFFRFFRNVDKTVPPDHCDITCKVSSCNHRREENKSNFILLIYILYCPMLHFQKYNATHTTTHSLLARKAKEVGGGGSYYDQQTSYYLLTSLLLYQGRWHYTSQPSVVIKRQKVASNLRYKVTCHLTGSGLSKSISSDSEFRLTLL